jgi:hypothetical protein
MAPQYMGCRIDNARATGHRVTETAPQATRCCVNLHRSAGGSTSIQPHAAMIRLSLTVIQVTSSQCQTTVRCCVDTTEATEAISVEFVVALLQLVCRPRHVLACCPCSSRTSSSACRAPLAFLCRSC